MLTTVRRTAIRAYRRLETSLDRRNGYSSGSTFKCNAVTEVSDFLTHDFFGCTPVECLSWSPIEQPSDVVEPSLAEGGQIRALGHELAQQAIGILVAAPLPGRVRIGEPDRQLQPLRQFLVPGHLAAPVVGQALAKEGRQPFHLTRKALQRGLGPAVVHLAQHHETALAL